MRPEHWIAIVSIIVTLLLACIGALISHVRHDERRHTSHEGRLSRVETDIGSHEIGMRGDIHRQNNIITWLAGCVWFMANKVGIELPKREK